MLRPYSVRAAPKAQAELKGKRIRKALLLLGLPLMVILGLLSPNDFLQTTSGGLRKLAVNCVHNIYALDKQMALDLPRPPTVTASLEIPSYISICKEWVQRGTGVEEALYTVEDDTVCMDWSSPHERLLEIFSSSILDRVNGKSRYRHDCYKSRQWDEAVTGMDRTTIQQMIPVARMDPNLLLVSEADMRAQCKVCLANFEPYVEKNQFKSYASHQCFSFPQEWEGETWSKHLKTTTGIAGHAIVLPEDPVLPNVVPLSTVYKQIRNRLGYVAKIFSNVTDAPPEEHNSGVVIFIDPTSKAIGKEIYPKFFPDVVTSITVLSSPLCATAVLATGPECMSYAEELVAYFKTLYPGLTKTGFDGSAGVQFQMAASSAGAFSRMILAKKLICPPATPTCLFPGMSKYQDEEAGFNTTAVIMECSHHSDCGKATAFFSNVGHGQRVTLERVDVISDVKKPASVAAPMSSDLGKAAEQFQWVMEDKWADEGYLTSQVPKTKLTRSAATAMADAALLDSIEVWNLPTTEANPNAYVPEIEVRITLEHIQTAVGRSPKSPINSNYGIRGTLRRVSQEMGLDCDRELSFAKRALTPAVSDKQKKLRDESQDRIQHFVQKAKAIQYADATNGDMAPSMEMEVFCPEVTDDGFKIEYNGGSTRVTKDDTVMISDGAGTVTFDKASLTESTIDMPRNAEQEQSPYTFIYDPVTRKNITISGRNITINHVDGHVFVKPVGMLMIDNQTDVNKATLVTEGGSGSLLEGDKKTIYSGTVISTGMNRADKGNVIRTGNGYAINEDASPGEQRTSAYWWNKFNDRDSPYSTAETGVRDNHRIIVNGKQPKQLTLEEQYKFEAPSPEPPVIGLVNDRQLHTNPVNTNRRLLDDETLDILAAMTRELHQKMHDGVPITILAQDFNFGNPDELARVCHHHKDKVLHAMHERELIGHDVRKLFTHIVTVPDKL